MKLFHIPTYGICQLIVNIWNHRRLIWLINFLIQAPIGLKNLTYHLSSNIHWIGLHAYEIRILDLKISIYIFHSIQNLTFGYILSISLTFQFKVSLLMFQLILWNLSFLSELMLKFFHFTMVFGRIQLLQFEFSLTVLYESFQLQLSLELHLWSIEGK